MPTFASGQRSSYYIDARKTTMSAEGLDLIVSVGGDGTFLRAARLASRSSVPPFDGFARLLMLLADLIDREARNHDNDFRVVAFDHRLTSQTRGWSKSRRLVEKILLGFFRLG